MRARSVRHDRWRVLVAIGQQLDCCVQAATRLDYDTSPAVERATLDEALGHCRQYLAHVSERLHVEVIHAALAQRQADEAIFLPRSPA